MDRVITYPVPSGVPTLEDLKKETYLRGADINFSENVLLEGVTVMNPALKECGDKRCEVLQLCGMVRRHRYDGKREYSDRGCLPPQLRRQYRGI